MVLSVLMHLLRRIENRHILWTALSMVAIGLIVPGGFGVKPPQWFDNRSEQDVGYVSSVEPDTADTSTSVVTSEKKPKVGGDLAIDRKTQQTLDLGQTNSGQVSPDRTNQVIVPVKLARYIPENHFELTVRRKNNLL